MSTKFGNGKLPAQERPEHHAEACGGTGACCGT